MKRFVYRFIAPMVRKFGWNSVCEIGASNGRTTDELLKLPIAGYTIVDPCFDEDLTAKYRADHHVTVLKTNSLDALMHPELLRRAVPFDCILIDGDHNWYTVFNELRLIHEHGLLRPGGFIFLHDVCWPYGRRDLYYQPDTIPADFRHPYAFRGIVHGQSRLGGADGYNADLANAETEGGPRNGVLTAIEDFLTLHAKQYRFFPVKTECGLGVLQLRAPGVRSIWPFLSLRIEAWTTVWIRGPGNLIRTTLRKFLPRRRGARNRNRGPAAGQGLNAQTLAKNDPGQP
jgi:hypothetical protein